MWAAIKRFLRNIFGGFFSSREDPRKALEQSIRDMRNRAPEINEGIVKARMIVTRLDNQGKDIDAEINGLTDRIKMCINAGDEDMGAELAIRLKRAKQSLDNNRKQAESARSVYDHMVSLKEKFIAEMKTRTEEAMRAIQEAEAAKWKMEIAHIFESLDMTASGFKHRDMIDELGEQTAEADAKLTVAKDLADMKSFEMEKKAAKLEGLEILNQIKKEMGLTAMAETGDESKETIGQNAEKEEEKN